MVLDEERKIKLESMQIKGIRWMIWQNIKKENIESRLLSIKGQGLINDLQKFVYSQSRATLIKLIEVSPEIESAAIDAAYEKYRYGLKPGFTLFWVKRFSSSIVSKDELEEKLKEYLSTIEFREDDKYKELKYTSCISFSNTHEISMSYLQRFNYIDSEGSLTYVYVMKECFVWAGVDCNFIAINNMPEILMTYLKGFFSKLYGANITNVRITNTLLNKVFSTDNTKRVTKYNPNPQTNQLEKVTFADSNMGEKKDAIPAGYESYDVTNTQYIEEIDSSTTGTLGVNCNKGKLYLSKSLTSTQFREWSIRRINQIIGFYENITEINMETILGYNMFTSSQWEGLKQSAISILNEIVYALVNCKMSKLDSYPIKATPYEVFTELSHFFYERVSFTCNCCEEKAIPVCNKCGSSQFTITKKGQARIICKNCGDTQENSFSFACEKGHESTPGCIDEALELISKDSFTQQLFNTIKAYCSNIAFGTNEYFTVTSSGITILQSPTYAKLKPSDISEFSAITNRDQVNKTDELNKMLLKLKEKCKYSTISKCKQCKYEICRNKSDIGCLLKLFEDFEGFVAQPHNGHEFGDVSMIVSLNGQNQTFLGIAKSGERKITKCSKTGREVIEQVINSFNDARVEITGFIYPGLVDDQLKQLLYNEAKVHNKRFVIMDHDFMIKLLDWYICSHKLSLQ